MTFLECATSRQLRGPSSGTCRPCRSPRPWPDCSPSPRTKPPANTSSPARSVTGHRPTPGHGRTAGVDDLGRGPRTAVRIARSSRTEAARSNATPPSGCCHPVFADDLAASTESELVQPESVQFVFQRVEGGVIEPVQIRSARVFPCRRNGSCASASVASSRSNSDTAASVAGPSGSAPVGARRSSAVLNAERSSAVSPGRS